MENEEKKVKKQRIIEKFANFAANTSLEEISKRIIEKVRYQIITAITAAKFSDWHKEAFKIFQALEEKGISPKNTTVIPINKKLYVEDAIIANVAYVISLDFDDYMLMGHMGYSSVLTPLGILENNNGSIADLIRITAITNEISGRISLACFFGPLNG
ncbi:MAG: MmgE/PrpD family protein [Promethearchaeota archaeon]